jgi:hypothetical protein
VLKKAGIVVATAAAGLLAVSPLAFAGSKDGHDGHRGHHDGGDDKRYSSHESRNEHNNNGDRSVFVQDGDGGNNACSNTQLGDFDAFGGNSGFLGLLPILNGNNALDQVNALQCVNLLNNNLNHNNVAIDVLGRNAQNNVELP